MSGAPRVAIGQWADRGRKPVQQDFHGACVPHTAPPDGGTGSSSSLVNKGIAVALADGISSSDVSQEASEHAVAAFLADYYATPDAWSVKTSVERVVSATSAWLHAQTQRERSADDRDRGYVCTFAALVLKAHTAHVFHVGDSRVYRVTGRALEALTVDHRVHTGAGRTVLARALGAGPHVDIDYRALDVEAGDVFLLTTDGVHEHMDPHFVIDAIERHAGDLDAAARAIVEEAMRRGSGDNLTAQVVRIDALPARRVDELARQLEALPLPPPLEARTTFDGYTILRALHVSPRSHLHLARDDASGALVVIKTPATDVREDPAALERFLLEEWVARRIDNPHVLAPHAPTRPRRALYVVSEYIDGVTLAQWMRDHPAPRLDAVRTIVEQIVDGLRAFHRREMLHQDLRPENVMIDAHGVVKIIDFGAVRVAGLAEMTTVERGEAILGTEQYTAPEYFVGDGGTPRSDQFSLGVIAYQMLCGRLPYGAGVGRVRTRAALAKLHYRSVLQADRDIPAWLDGVLRKAVHPDPAKRYQALSEFLHDLRHPRREATSRGRAPWAERDPVRFWKVTSAVLLVVVVVLVHLLTTGRR